MNGAIADHGYWLRRLDDGQLWDRPLALALFGLFGGQRVLDMGCGRGWYTQIWRQAGIVVDAIDGSPWVADDVPGAVVVDLALPYDPPQKYDWVFCLEVGEHIPQEYECQFLDNVCNAATAGVVLSWAIPGQSGTGHVNCRDNAYVIAEMQRRGWVYNSGKATAIRSICQLPYLHDTLMIFLKKTY